MYSIQLARAIVAVTSVFIVAGLERPAAMSNVEADKVMGAGACCLYVAPTTCSGLGAPNNCTGGAIIGCKVTPIDNEIYCEPSPSSNADCSGAPHCLTLRDADCI